MEAEKIPCLGSLWHLDFTWLMTVGENKNVSLRFRSQNKSLTQHIGEHCTIQSHIYRTLSSKSHNLPPTQPQIKAKCISLARNLLALRSIHTTSYKWCANSLP